MAIFGLLMFFLSFYIVAIGTENLQDMEANHSQAMGKESFQFNSYMEELTSYNHELKLLSPKLENLAKDVEETLENVKKQGTKLSIDNKSEILRQVENFENIFDGLNEKISNQNIAINDAQNEVKESEIIRKKYAKEKYNMEFRLERNIRVGWVLFSIGTFLMLYGFTLWYIKHQRYIDAEREWQGEIFIELLRDEEAKRKAVLVEQEKKKESK